MWLRCILLSVAMAWAGCAGGGSTPASEADAPDVVDTGEPDAVAPDVADVAPDVPDLAEDPSNPEPDTRCDVCCPGETRCAADATEVCSEDGSAWEPGAACGAFETCQAGACGVHCATGETVCRDAENQQTCDVGGTSWTVRRCAGGRCVGGRCREGALTSSACTADAECAGGACLCTGERDCPDGLLADGFCTTADCAVDGCEPVRETCVDFSVSGAFGGGSHCVRYCADCPGERGLRCRQLPVRDGDRIVWREACFAQYPRDMGSKCAVDADCLGGVCWTGQRGPSDGLGYCTAPCTDHEACPGTASCVKFPGVEGTFCGVHCGNGDVGSGDCPEFRGVATRCRPLEAFDARRLYSICEPVLP